MNGVLEAHRDQCFGRDGDLKLRVLPKVSAILENRKQTACDCAKVLLRSLWSRDSIANPENLRKRPLRVQSNVDERWMLAQWWTLNADESDAASSVTDEDREFELGFTLRPAWLHPWKHDPQRISVADGRTVFCAEIKRHVRLRVEVVRSRAHNFTWFSPLRGDLQ